MRAKDAKRLVIDANVLCAAGIVDSAMDRNRGFLNQVRVLRHRMVMTRELSAELQRNQSKFGRRWLASMYDRRLVFECGGNAYSSLSEQIRWLPLGDSDKSAMEKDRHLIAAAIATDRRIVSADEAARRPFRRAARDLERLREIVWVNPLDDDEEPIRWLEFGAPADEFRCLGYVDPDANDDRQRHR